MHSYMLGKNCSKVELGELNINKEELRKNKELDELHRLSSYKNNNSRNKSNNNRNNNTRNKSNNNRNNNSYNRTNKKKNKRQESKK